MSSPIDDRERLMRVIDTATDPGWDEELPDREQAPTAYGMRQQATQERIAAALGAIAFLMLHQDSEMLDEWRRY